MRYHRRDDIDRGLDGKCMLQCVEEATQVSVHGKRVRYLLRTILRNMSSNVAVPTLHISATRVRILWAIGQRVLVFAIFAFAFGCVARDVVIVSFPVSKFGADQARSPWKFVIAFVKLPLNLPAFLKCLKFDR